MTLSWNEIKSRAVEFSNEWKDEFNEHAEAKSFMDAFFNVFGITRRRVASFEQHVKKEDGHQGFIDLLWKGNILIEFKSRGKNLDKAHQQAKDYFPGLKDGDLFTSEANRMVFLFELYEKYTARLFVKEKKKKINRR